MATSTASSSSAALVTVTAMSCSAPFGVARSTGARGPPAPTSPRTRARRRRPSTPDAPETISTTESLVDMHPSESSRSSVREQAERSRAVRSVFGGGTASQVRTTSMVARPGASMPAPLAIPPTTQPVTVDDHLLGHGVGGHDRGGGVVAPGRRTGQSTPRPTPADRRSRGRSRPMSPVEQTTTSPAPTPRPATDLLSGGVRGGEALRSGEAVRPTGVQDHRANDAVGAGLLAPQHGVGLAPVVGETAPARASGPVLTTRATSRFPLGLSPATTPAAVNPWAAVTLTVPPPAAADRSSPADPVRGSSTGPRHRRSPW